MIFKDASIYCFPLSVHILIFNYTEKKCGNYHTLLYIDNFDSFSASQMSLFYVLKNW